MFFFFNDTATTEIYTLSLHDALPISQEFICSGTISQAMTMSSESQSFNIEIRDRKSTRLNSSHTVISYAVFCLKKKKKHTTKKHQANRSNRRARRTTLSGRSSILETT